MFSLVQLIGTDPEHDVPSDDDVEEELHMGQERMEEDEELRLHVLGCKTYFTKFNP